MKRAQLSSSCRSGGGGCMTLLLFVFYSWCFVDLSTKKIIATALATDTSSSSSSVTRSSSTTTSTTNPTIIYKSRDYHLLEVVPHSRTSFTQGLTLSATSNILYEGTGLNHQSQILQHDPTQNMKTLEQKRVEPGYVFGEGITTYYVDRRLTTTNNSEGDGDEEEEEKVVREHRLIQLTWKDRIGMIYRINHTPSSSSSTTTTEDNDNTNNEQQTDGVCEEQQQQPPPPTESLELIDKFTFNTHTNEGWGITFVPHTNEFYVSDGSEYIFVWDVETLQEKRRMAVTLERREGGENEKDGGNSSVRIKYINELEFVDFHAKNKCGGDVKDWDIDDVYLEECQEGDGDQTCSSSTNSKSAGAGAAGAEECSNDNGTGFTSTMSILANVWYQDVLVRIDPVTAKITRVYDLSDIYPYDQRKKDGDDIDCFNGISVTGKESSEEEGLELWVTGKLWPHMYRIRLID